MKEKKVCMYCGIEVKPVIASPNSIYGVPDFENPRGAMPIFTGDYYCPKCKRGNCFVSIPLLEKDKNNLENMFKLKEKYKHDLNLEKFIPEIQEYYKEVYSNSSHV